MLPASKEALARSVLSRYGGPIVLGRYAGPIALGEVVSVPAETSTVVATAAQPKSGEKGTKATDDSRLGVTAHAWVKKGPAITEGGLRDEARGATQVSGATQSRDTGRGDSRLAGVATVAAHAAGAGAVVNGKSKTWSEGGGERASRGGVRVRVAAMIGSEGEMRWGLGSLCMVQWRMIKVEKGKMREVVAGLFWDRRAPGALDVSWCGFNRYLLDGGESEDEKRWGRAYGGGREKVQSEEK
ncbi:unnamed protein product [Sphenostylis stenocarpa]|uniref:Uncharacterized protein n=1 Tax=Sphenostylis stenocarpa TaxID=92480 RepID=A0AA86VRG3_9FABA|nr:unnamed protein product [Sphenostylis stenocarpa]